MTQRRISRIVSALAVLVLAFSSGCEWGFVTRAARTNASSFLVDVFSAVVNETVSPD